MNKLYFKPILLTGIVSMMAAVILFVYALVLYYSPSSEINREISKVDEHLNANNLSGLEGSIEVLEKSAYSGNTAALDRLLQIAYMKNDIMDLNRYYDLWLQIDPGCSIQNDMYSAIVMMDKQQSYDALASTLNENKRNRMDILDELKNKYPEDPELVEYHEKYIVYLAECDWLDGLYQEAMEKLLDAEEILPGNESIRDELLKVAESNIIEYLAGQKYDEAEAIVNKCMEIYGRDVFERYRETILDMRDIEERIQSSLAELSVALRKNNTVRIKELLTDNRFLKSIKYISDCVYESRIAENGDADGIGIALYNVNDRPYIYYGRFIEGKREGTGEWFYCDENDELCRYKLNFTDDIPDGKGSCERKTALTVIDDIGRDIGEIPVTVSENFTLSDGVMDGKCEVKARVEDRYNSVFSLELNYADGYLSVCEEDCRPSKDIFNDQIPICSWTVSELYDDYWDQKYESTIWCNSSVKRRCVEGIRVKNPEFTLSDKRFETVSNNSIVYYSEENLFYATANTRRRPDEYFLRLMEDDTPVYIPDILHPIDREIYPKAAKALDEAGWDLKKAYYWSVKNLTYYGNGKPDMPEHGEPGIAWYADFGFTNNKGNCFVFAATFCEMSRLLGYTTRQMYGQVPYALGGLTPHSWVEIDIDGQTYVFDPEYQYQTGKNGFMIHYGMPGTWQYTAYSPMED